MQQKYFDKFLKKLEKPMKKRAISIIVGNRLRARRMELGYSQSDASERSGLHNNAMI
jgi:hypothetical protein